MYRLEINKVLAQNPSANAKTLLDPYGEILFSALFTILKQKLRNFIYIYKIFMILVFDF